MRLHSAAFVFVLMLAAFPEHGFSQTPVSPAPVSPVTVKKPKPPPPVPPPLPPLPYEMEEALPGLKFEMPVGVATIMGDSERLFVIERAGRVQLVKDLGADSPQKQKQLFLEIQPRDGKLVVEGECGLLGLAFHPGYQENGFLFVYYSLRKTADGKLHQRVSRFHAPLQGAERDLADPGSEQVLITQEDPASNHNGGDLQFGPDGCLYITVGDGGAGNDKFDNGRFINKGFHAAILRIDVDKKPGSLPPNPHPAVEVQAESAFYAIPPDNPFIGATSHHGQVLDPKTVRTEIWASGLRNPWRMAFDGPTERLFTGDVGQNLYEEINLITKGGDYGWSWREALHPFSLGPGADKEPAGYDPVPPIYEYPRTVGLSVTGGIVYRGGKFPELNEQYLFADYAFGRIIALKEQDKNPIWKDQIIAVEAGITGIGTDPRDGEVLFVNMALGSIKRLKKK